MCQCKLFFEIDTQSRTRGHRLKIVNPRPATNAPLHSFSQRVDNSLHCRWKTLLKETVYGGTINSFESHVQKIRPTNTDFSLTI